MKLKQRKRGGLLLLALCLSLGALAYFPTEAFAQTAPPFPGASTVTVSSLAELNTAIADSSFSSVATVIKLTDDIDLGGTVVTIPLGAQIMLESADASRKTLRQDGTDCVIFMEPNSTLYLDGISITGGVNNPSPAPPLAFLGGGISCPVQGGTLALLGNTEIYGNTAPQAGGGVFFSGDSLYIEGSVKIHDNSSGGMGGGVCAQGGDVSIGDNARIYNNQAVDGGGVYAVNITNAFLISGSTSISGNTASGDGGGIWIDDPATLAISAPASFSGNRASAAFEPTSPLFTGAGIAWTAPFTWGDNNYDINTTDTSTPVFLVVLDANGGTVYPAVMRSDADGKLVGLLPTPTRLAYRFVGWFTSANGGVQVDANTVFAANTTIYAQWDYVGIPPTGDNEMALLWLCGMLASLGSIVVFPHMRNQKAKAK